MLGDSSTSVLATSTTNTTTISTAGGGGGGGSEEAPPILGGGEVGQGLSVEGGDGIGGGGNRWPRQETLALLKIRSDMDLAFSEASVKGPLWDEVSRRLSELGYHRSAKKCREKFENVYKYHRRTKEGRVGKLEGKTYRFFDQLEAFEHHQKPQPLPPPPPPPQLTIPPRPQAPVAATTSTMPVANAPPSSIGVSHHVISTIPSTTTPPPLNLAFPTSFTQFATNLTNPTGTNMQSSNLLDFMSNSTSSSSTSSDEDVQERRGRGKKRKWKKFFRKLMNQVMRRQEEMQKKFLEAIEKREQERITREESWRVQEMARITREREILTQERSMAAAKDAAVLTLLQKISSEQTNPDNSQNVNNPPPVPPPQPPTQVLQTPPPPQPPAAPRVVVVHQTATPMPPPPPQVQNQERHHEEMAKLDDSNGDGAPITSSTTTPPSSSRWPKVEVEALINLRTRLDTKYQENGPKGPLWEEISGGMKRLGYNRNAKRCKEKWENINKYFKKVKESNKQRPEDSKTCPYFHQLDALYKERNFIHGNNNINISSVNSVPLMVRPEQQWPPPPPQQQHQLHHQQHNSLNLESGLHQNHEDYEDDDEMDDDDDEDEGEGGGYEIVQNNKNQQQQPPPPQASIATGD